MEWKKPSEIFKDCDPELTELARHFNEHFQEMEVMTPNSVVYDGRENPNKLYNQLKTKYEFFTKSKWTLERYRNKHEGKLNYQERLLIKYLDDFYLEFYPMYEQKLIGVIDDLTRKLGRFNDNFEQ